MSNATQNGQQQQNTALAKRPPTALDQTLRLAKLYAASGFFSDSKEIAQAGVKIDVGQQIGLTAFQSMTGIFFVKNKLTMSATLMAAKVKQSGRDVRSAGRGFGYDYKVTKNTDTLVEIEFVEVNGKNDTTSLIGTSTFSMADAQKAGLTGNDTYRKFPRNMLFARAMSNGVRWYCADVFGCPVYTPEEITVEVADVAASGGREIAQVAIGELQDEGGDQQDNAGEGGGGGTDEGDVMEGEVENRDGQDKLPVKVDPLSNITAANADDVQRGSGGQAPKPKGRTRPPVGAN